MKGKYNRLLKLQSENRAAGRNTKAALWLPELSQALQLVLRAASSERANQPNYPWRVLRSPVGHIRDQRTLALPSQTVQNYFKGFLGCHHYSRCQGNW